MGKIQVYHFHNGQEGGVLSVIRNLLQYSSNPLIENHVIHTINKDLTNKYHGKSLQGAATERVFYYSRSWNFYYTCDQLYKFLPDENAVIISHDWLELGMASNLGIPNRIITFLHGDYNYYYHLSQLHESSIDKFIGIANDITIKLKELLPNRENDISYLRVPVPEANYRQRSEQLINIVFVGRLTKEKGYPLLPIIDSLLKKKNIHLNWHVVGEEGIEDIYKEVWDSNTSVRFYGSMKNEDVLLLLRKMDSIVLPSTAEGMPIAIIEAMKSGVIPIVNDMKGGIQELVVSNVTGFKILNNSPYDYVESICQLIEDKNLAISMRDNCVKLANALFDPFQNTDLIEEEICNTFLLPVRNKKAKKIYGSRLDQKWIPNLFTNCFRNIKR